MDEEPMDEGDSIVGKVTIMKISLDTFWDNFLAEDAKFPIDEFFTVRGESNTALTEWKDGPQTFPEKQEEGIEIPE